MKIRYAAALAVLAGSVTAPACLSGQAHAAVPNCGGQSAAPQPVPYTCVLPPKVIDGTAFSAVVHANGTIVTVTITLAEPRTVDTPARIVHHVDISGAGGPADLAQGVIPAGATSITLVDSVPCRAGQLDVKAVFVAPGAPEGRIGGPWITNGVDCMGTQATTPGAPLTPGPGASTPTLPATGFGNAAMVMLGGAVVTAGLLLVKAGVRRP